MYHEFLIVLLYFFEYSLMCDHLALGLIDEGGEHAS